jgi:hypothetical protein
MGDVNRLAVFPVVLNQLLGGEFPHDGSIFFT